MSVEPLLEIDGLTIDYVVPGGRLRAVSDVSISLARGEALGLVGESGSGKSSIATCVLDLAGPGATITARRIALGGVELGSLSGSRRRAMLGDRIGTVFQDPFTSLNPSLTIGRQIAEPLVLHRRFSPAAAHERAVQLLDEMGIHRPAEAARAYPHQLSGGMKQRALIAAALACEPDIMILDEPTTALDVTIEAQILDLLRDLRARRGMGILFISHNLAVVRSLCDRIAVMYAGRLVEIGPAADVFEAPIHPYTKGLLASLPALTRPGQALRPIPGRLPDLREPQAGCVFAARCPFAIHECKLGEPRLDAEGVDRRVRCIRAETVGPQPWPAAATASHRAIGWRGNEETAVAAEGLSKRFLLGSGWGMPGLLARILPGRSAEQDNQVLAVDDVDLSLARGEILGLVGESGSGKSTLGRLLIRLIEPTEGRVRIADIDITALARRQLRALRRYAQIVFQNPDSSLNPRRRVGDAIARPVRLFDTGSASDIKGRTAELLDLVQLPADYSDRYPHQLSGGEKQRIAIARALATRPKFIVCDEAVSALDVSVQAAIVNLLANLRTELGLTLLFISHDISIVAHLADRIAVMYGGSICEIGPAQQVLRPPHHPYTEALLSAIPGAGRGSRIRLSPSRAQAERITGCPFADRCPVRIGTICDGEKPPIQSFGNGHVIRCHHPRERLYAASDVLQLLAHTDRQIARSSADQKNDKSGAY